jgi:hypothetical protein
MSQTVTDTALETTFAAFMVAIALSRHIITPANAQFSFNAWQLAEEVNGLKFGDSRDFRVYPDALAHGFSIFIKSLNLVTPVETSLNKPTSNNGYSVSSFGRLKEMQNNLSVKFIGVAPIQPPDKLALITVISGFKDSLLNTLETTKPAKATSNSTTLRGNRDPDLYCASLVLDELKEAGVQVACGVNDELGTTPPPAPETKKLQNSKDPSSYSASYNDHIKSMEQTYPGSIEEQKLAVLEAAVGRLTKDIAGKKRKRSDEKDTPTSPSNDAAGGAIDRIMENMSEEVRPDDAPENAEAAEAELYWQDCSDAIMADAEADGAYHPADEAEDAEDAQAGANVPLKNNLQELAMDPAIKAAINKTIPQ